MTIARDFNPDVRIAGSDGVDFYTLSQFDKNPDRAKSIDYEVDAWARGQREWQTATPNAMAIFIIGNHEFRLQRYLWRHQEIATLEALQITKFMRLDELGIVYEDTRHEMANQEVRFGDLVIKHGSLVRKHSAYSARVNSKRSFIRLIRSRDTPTVVASRTQRHGTVSCKAWKDFAYVISTHRTFITLTGNRELSLPPLTKMTEAYSSSLFFSDVGSARSTPTGAATNIE